MRMLTGGLLFFWILERSSSFLPMFYKTTKARHMVVNPGFTAMHLFVHSFLALFILLSYCWVTFSKVHQWGFIYWLNAGVWGAILITILILYFLMGWLVHITEHKIPSLFRFFCSVSCIYQYRYEYRFASSSGWKINPWYFLFYGVPGLQCAYICRDDFSNPDRTCICFYTCQYCIAN